MSLLESQRYVLEELEVLEEAMAARLRRNFDLVPEYTKNIQDEAISQTKKRPRKETIAQQTELKIFKDIYKRKVQRVLDNRSSRRDLFQEEIEKLEDKGGTCRQFEKMLDTLRQKHRDEEIQGPGSAADVAETYRMFSVAPEELKRTKKGKLKANRRHVLSKAGSFIDIDKIFSSSEAYGKSLGLRRFYEKYLRMVKEERSYVSYLSMFDQVPYDSIRRIADYRIYLKELTEYLLFFFERARPLEDVGAVKKGIEEAYSQHCKNSEGRPNENGEIFCKACQRLFSKETVYNSHLLGKKHLKNLATHKENNGDNASFETNVTKENSKERPENDLGFLEFELRQLAQKLNEERESAKSDAERSSTLTEREKIIEAASVADEDSEFTPVDSDSDEEGSNDSSEEDEDISLKNLPLGADGKPIPYWLYKLQGLHKSYNCEICGNMTYRGINLFYKHFTGQKHQHGLRCLGVSDDYIPLFKNIVRIDEALEYWRYLKKAKRVKENENENAVEVEDNEGNVLPEKDYLELKKQGLL